MNGIKKFILQFSQRYEYYGSVECITERYDCDGCSFADDIESILDQVYDTFKHCNIPVEEDSSKTNPKCVKAFKFLLLNTDFECKEDLARDPVNGPAARINDPKMNPYVLLEIVWRLEYEQILAESLLHVPLDLCIEILVLVKKNINIWEFERRLDLVITILWNCHQIFISVSKYGTQSNNLNRKLLSLVYGFRYFTALLLNPEFLSLSEVKNLEKSERIGIVLKKIIALTSKCLSGCGIDAVPPEIAEAYRLRFGDDPIQKFEENPGYLSSISIRMVVIVLFAKLQELNGSCCYLDWANLEAAGSPSVSLQRSIRNDIYNLVELLKVHRRIFDGYGCTHYEPLMKRLHVFDPLPQCGFEIFSTLNLDDLRYGSLETKIESLKNVMHRYSEWDHATFDLIQRNRILLDANDISYLIDYLVLIMRKPGQQYHKRRVFLTIRRALYHQRLVNDNWELSLTDSSDDESESLPVIEFNESWETEEDESYELFMDDSLGCLEFAYSSVNFMSFIADNKDLKSPKHLRTMLSYWLYNPRGILYIFISVIIGVPKYAHWSITSEDLIFFYPVIQLGGSDMRLLLTEINNVVRNERWNATKFTNFLYIMLNEFKFTANDLVMHVLTSVIEKPAHNLSDYLLVLKFINSCVFEKCTAAFDIEILMDAFVSSLVRFRTNLLLPKLLSNKLFIQMRETATPFIDAFRIECYGKYTTFTLEPMDRLMSPFSNLTAALLVPDTISAFSVVNISLMCSYGIKLARDVMMGVGLDMFNGGGPGRLHREIFLRLYDDLIRYIMIKGTETEMFSFVIGLFRSQLITNPDTRFKFRLISNLFRLSVDSAIYLLEYPYLNPPESFACLMRGLAQFLAYVICDIVHEFNKWSTSREFLQNIKRMEQLYRCWTFLPRILKTLEKSVQYTAFYPFYKALMAIVNDPSIHNLPRGVALCRIRYALEIFGNNCLRIPHSQVRFDGPHSHSASKVKMTHQFIHECMTARGDFATDKRKFDKLCATWRLLRNWPSEKRPS